MQQPHSRYLIRCKDGSVVYADLTGSAAIEDLWKETERVTPNGVAFFQRVPLPNAAKESKEYIQ